MIIIRYYRNKIENQTPIKVGRKSNFVIIIGIYRNQCSSTNRYFEGRRDVS